MRLIILGIALICITHSCVVRVTTAAAIESDIVCPIEQSDDSFVVQYPSRVSCNIFYKCNRGVAIKVECSDGLHYNERIQACDYPGRANCRLNIKPESEPNAEAQEVVQEARSFFGPKTEVIQSDTLDVQALQKILESVLLELKIVLGLTPRFSEEEQQQYTNAIQNNFVSPQLTEFLQLPQEEPLTEHSKPTLADKDNEFAEVHPKLPPTHENTKKPSDSKQESENPKEKETSQPKLPQLSVAPVAATNDNTKKPNDSKHESEISIPKEKETPLPKLPQLNGTSIASVVEVLEEEEDELPKLPTDNKTKESDEKKDAKPPQKPTESGGKKKIKTSTEPGEPSKQLRVGAKQPMKKPNKQPSAAAEEDNGRREENKDESDSKKSASDKKEDDKKGDDNQKAEKGKDKIELENDKEEEKREQKIEAIAAASVDSEESFEDDEHDANTLLEGNQPKPIRRTTHDSEQNSDETISSSDIVKDKPKLPTPPIDDKNGKENHKKPADKDNKESKKPIEIKNKNNKESAEDES